MKVKDLMNRLGGMNPDALVVLEGRDHSYRPVNVVYPTQADRRGASRKAGSQLRYAEHNPEDAKADVVPVIVVTE